MQDEAFFLFDALSSAAMNEIAAFVLSGGKSSRMGSDKALLEVGGKPLIARAIELASKLSPDVAIVGDPRKLAGFGQVITDVYPERGPLGGIHAALLHSNADLNLIMAVDLPFLTVEFLEFLLQEARSSAATVTVASAGTYLHPLCAIYRKSFAGAAERALLEGRNKIDALFQDVPMRVIGDAELNANGFASTLLRNVNTPEEWERARSDLRDELGKNRTP